MPGKKRFECPKCGSKAYICLSPPWSYPRIFSCRSCDTYFKVPSDEEREQMRAKRLAKAEGEL